MLMFRNLDGSIVAQGATTPGPKSDTSRREGTSPRAAETPFDTPRPVAGYELGFSRRFRRQTDYIRPLTGEERRRRSAEEGDLSARLPRRAITDNVDETPRHRARTIRAEFPTEQCDL